MKKATLCAIAGICACLMFGVAEAGSKPRVVSPKKIQSFMEDPIAMSVLAEQLITYAEQKNDPLAMILAAKIKKGIVVLDKQAAPASAANEAKELLEKAKAMSGDRPEVVALADDALQTGSRGVLENIQQIRETVKGGATYRIPLTFKGSEFTTVGVLLDSSAGGKREEYDLDLYVYSGQGNHTICSVEGPGIPEKCSWTPEKTGKYVIEMVNRTKLDTPFVLLFR